MKELAKEWIAQAENDYLVAVREFNADPIMSDAVCFHSQQCVEKYMKALLQENGIPFEKVHDLDILLRDCRNFLPELAARRDGLVKLSTFAVDVRYPGFPVSVDEADACLRIMQEVREMMRNYFLSPPG